MLAVFTVNKSGSVKQCLISSDCGEPIFLAPDKQSDRDIFDSGRDEQQIVCIISCFPREFTLGVTPDSLSSPPPPLRDQPAGHLTVMNVGSLQKLWFQLGSSVMRKWMDWAQTISDKSIHHVPSQEHSVLSPTQ
ncbi:unnamed protein product [Pleuronectes platessa]|uniref:Uncharacterized protein n=1 Tax=Pleuronectes platessa TaxID=8262 RepID=A0A9N7Z7B4_PLEPL|nr:unnamed protein product [Pleuronectes platessa]